MGSDAESTTREYRLSWEYRAAFGAGWHRTERIAPVGSDILDQHAMLSEWAATGEEPIRDVKLEVRETNDWELSRV